MKKRELHLAMFISTTGMIMRDVLIGCKRKHLSRVKPALIISSDPNAAGIKMALEMGFPAINIAVIAPEDFETPEAFGEEILRECKKHGADSIASLGFAPIIPPNVVDAYRSMIFGLHAGPLDGERPGFGGKGIYGLALQHAILHFAKLTTRPFRMSEVCVHRVTEKINGGDLLGIRRVEIWLGDSAKTLGARALPFAQNLAVEIFLRLSELEGLQEIHRSEPLIWPGEEALLEEAKAAGIAAFPNG